MKQCTKCKTSQPLNNFSCDKNRKDGLATHCRSCCKAYQTASRSASSYRQRERRKHERYYRDQRAETLIKSAKRRAKTKNIPFDLDAYIPELRGRLLLGKCEITGIAFTFEGGRTFDSPSLDRIIPELGYVYTNVRWVCDIINTAMGSYGKECLYAVVSTWVRKRAGESLTKSNVGRLKVQADALNVNAL